MEDVLRRYIEDPFWWHYHVVNDTYFVYVLVLSLSLHTASIPVPFPDREGHQGGLGAPGSPGALEFLPTVFNHKQNLWHRSKFRAMKNICCIIYSCFVFSHCACWLDPKLFVCVFPELSCCWDTNPFKRASQQIAQSCSHSPSAFCYSHTELYSQHLDGDLHRSAGTNLWHQEMRQSCSQAQAVVPGWRGVPRGVYQCCSLASHHCFLVVNIVYRGSDPVSPVPGTGKKEAVLISVG